MDPTAATRYSPLQAIAARELPAASTIVVITDANVWKWHGVYFSRAFRGAGVPDPLVYVLPPGEESKSRDTKAAIEDWMLGNK